MKKLATLFVIVLTAFMLSCGNQGNDTDQTSGSIDSAAIEKLATEMEQAAEEIESEAENIDSEIDSLLNQLN